MLFSYLKPVPGKIEDVWQALRMCVCPASTNNTLLTIQFLQVACKQGNVFMWQPVQLNLKRSCMIMSFRMLKINRQGCTRLQALFFADLGRFILVIV